MFAIRAPGNKNGVFPFFLRTKDINVYLYAIRIVTATSRSMIIPFAFSVRGLNPGYPP